MKKPLIYALVGLLLGTSAQADTNTGQQLSAYAAHPWQNAEAARFSGAARFARLPAIPGSAAGIGIVEFSAGSVTDWHSHSHGQYLIVTEGEGRTQEWGKPVQTIKKGDVIWCPPNVKHWHGAAEHSKMTHIVISPDTKNNQAAWSEKVELPKPDHHQQLQKISQHGPLDKRQLALVPIAFWSAKGELDKLKPALEQGLASGLTISELQETFIHQYAYAGFPRALNGLLTLQNLLKERSGQGISDPPGETAAASTDPDYYQLGTRTMNILNGRDNSAVLWNTPGVDYALKAHLFGYLFSRDHFSAVNREIVTVATLAALESVPNQLRSHLAILQNLGIPASEQQRLVDNIAAYHPTAAEKAATVLAQMPKP